MLVNQKVAIEHGLKSDEYKKICSLLKRTPNITELGIFSAMWNEHCSYKSSKLHLKKLHTKSKKVIQGPGENAGVIDIDDGDAIVFKIESHNHPSYLEPYQGAATGVGGILRDVFVNQTPIVFIKELYASASFIGAVVFYFTLLITNEIYAATIIGIVLTTGLRLVAMKYNWNLPKVKSR